MLAAARRFKSEMAMQLAASQSRGLPATADETDPQTLLKFAREARG